MSNFVGRPPFSNLLWVAIETMQFHIAQTKFCFEDTFVSHSGGPNEQFGTHEKLSGVGVQGNLNLMPGYLSVIWIFRSQNYLVSLLICILI